MPAHGLHYDEMMEGKQSLFFLKPFRSCFMASGQMNIFKLPVVYTL